MTILHSRSTRNERQWFTLLGVITNQLTNAIFSIFLTKKDIFFAHMWKLSPVLVHTCTEFCKDKVYHHSQVFTCSFRTKIGTDF